MPRERTFLQCEVRLGCVQNLGCTALLLLCPGVGAGSLSGSWAKDWWHLVASFSLDCLLEISLACSGRLKASVTRIHLDHIPTNSHRRIFSLIPAVKILFLSDPHDCSTVTKLLATCKTPSWPVWGKKSPCLCLEAGNWSSERVTVPLGLQGQQAVGTAQPGHFGLLKLHPHNQGKRGCRTAVGHRLRNLPSVFPGFGKFSRGSHLKYLGH